MLLYFVEVSFAFPEGEEERMEKQRREIFN